MARLLCADMILCCFNESVATMHLDLVVHGGSCLGCQYLLAIEEHSMGHGSLLPVV